MIRITRQAARHLEKLRNDKGLDTRAAARFVRRDGRVGLTFASQPEKGDRVVPREGMDIYLAPSVAETFEESVIDARTANRRTWLVLRRQDRERQRQAVT